MPDDPQEVIENSPARRIRVLAGPGAGKSYGLQRRVARLISDGVDPTRILAVTFTRAAAQALKADLAAIGEEAARIQATTLHSLCFRALMRERTLESTGRVPRTLLSYELEPLLADLMDSYAGESYSGVKRKKSAIRAFESAWAQLQSQEPGWPHTPHEVAFHNDLTGWLRFHRAMLIGEVVPTVLEYLRNNPEAGPRFDHVLTDEYQDLNRAEQELIDEIGKDGDHLVIGDDDQSIYSFKFAHPEGVIEYTQRWPETVAIDFESCRRCPPLVVDMANALMNAQTNRLTERALQCFDPGKPQDVDVVRWANVDAEVQGVAKYIKAYLTAHPEIPPGKVLILSPRRHLGYKVSEALEVQGIQSRSYFQEQELDQKLAQEAYSLLRLLVDPTDRVAIRWWVGRNSTSWNKGAYARVRAHCYENHVELTDALDQMVVGSLSIPYSAGIRESWADLKQRLADLQGKLGMDLVDALVPIDFDPCAKLRSLCLEVVTEDMPPATLFDEVGELIRGPEVPQESEVVRVMSLHKSKGLTADVVVVLGVLNGLIPLVQGDGSSAADQRQLEEQRRLFYVAITRTRRALLLSSSAAIPTAFAREMGMPFVTPGFNYSTTASRFLAEITPPAPAAVGSATLAGKYGF